MQKNKDIMEYEALQHKRKSCCGVFSLQTGAMLIVITDVLVFILISCITGMTVENFVYFEDSNKGIGFTVMSDGILLLMFFVRLCYGLWYSWSVLFPPKMDY